MQSNQRRVDGSQYPRKWKSLKYLSWQEENHNIEEWICRWMYQIYQAYPTKIQEALKLGLLHPLMGILFWHRAANVSVKDCAILSSCLDFIQPKLYIWITRDPTRKSASCERSFGLELPRYYQSAHGNHARTFALVLTQSEWGPTACICCQILCPLGPKARQRALGYCLDSFEEV